MKKQKTSPFHAHIKACPMCLTGLPDPLCGEGSRLFQENRQLISEHYARVDEVKKAHKAGAQ